MSVRLYKMSWIFELVITLLNLFFLHFISFASFLFGFIPYLTSFFFNFPSLCCAVCNVLSFDLFFLCHYYQMTMMMLICSISHSMLTCSFFKTMVNGYYGSSAFRIFFFVFNLSDRRLTLRPMKSQRDRYVQRRGIERSFKTDYLVGLKFEVQIYY